MDKIWLKSYPPGVPAEVGLDTLRSLTDLLQWACQRNGTQCAFANEGTSLTWARLDTLSRHFAAYLQRLGLRKGDRVAIMLPNLLQYPVALFGALRAGCVVVNVDPRQTAREIEYQLADAAVTAIVVLDNFSQ